MKWLVAFHIIFVVCWFAGLFYLPRLFIYHLGAKDSISIERFKIMEHRLFWFIMSPAGVLASLFGLWVVWLRWQHYLSQSWLIAKLFFVLLLWCYHVYCGYLLSSFKKQRYLHSAKFYRVFNEIPTVILFIVVILVKVKPVF